jgi:hypothetical protein
LSSAALPSHQKIDSGRVKAAISLTQSVTCLIAGWCVPTSVLADVLLIVLLCSIFHDSASGNEGLWKEGFNTLLLVLWG